MQKVVSNSFAITASKDAVSFDHQDNYSLIEASGNMPTATDSRWQFIPVGGQALKPTSAAPYLWHKVITFLTDGSHLDPVISFGGSMGQNGIDYDLVPSVSSILKAENNTLTPANVSCAMIKRNADGSAQNLSSIPSSYTIRCYRDASASNYSLGQQISTSGVTVISFVLQYNGTDIERHDIRVITEGSQGIDGRGIQSQDYRFKATDSDTAPNTPTNETQWNTWLSLQGSNYSELLPYLWKCIKTTYVDGNGRIDIEYHVEGPTVWGQSPTHVVSVYGSSQSSTAGANYPETGSLNPCKQKIYFDKTIISEAKSRGLVLEVIDPRTGERKLTSGNVFDTYGSTEAAGNAKATELANLIYNYLDTDYLICLASYDACAINADLINMLRNFGLGREMVSFSRARKAFAFVGQSGMDYGQASYKFIPNNGEIAMVKATVTDGQLVPSMVHQSLFDVDIDNEMTSVPVSYNASGNGSTQSQIIRSFGLSAFMGATNVISDCQVAVVGTLPTGITANVSNKSNPSVTIANGTALPPTTEITFRVTYADLEARDVVFTIAAVMPGKSGDNSVFYELLPSITEIAVGRTSEGGYTPNPLNYAITCGYVKYDGQEVVGTSSDLTNSIDGYNIYFRMRQRSNGTWGSYYKYSTYKDTYLAINKFNVLTYNKLEFILCKNTGLTISSEANINSLIDRESIPVVADGVNGTSPYTVDLDNEMGVIACDADGTVVTGTTFTLRATAWYGLTDVTAALTFDAISKGNNSITVNNTIATNHNLTVTVPTGTSLDDVTEIRIPVKHSTYEPNGRTLIFSIAAVRPGGPGEKAILRELLPSLSQISFARVAGSNNLTPASRTLTATIRRTEGGVSTEQTISAANAVVRWNLYSMPSSKSAGYDISTNTCTVPSTTSATCVYLAAFDKDSGAVLDKETVPILKSGEIGETGNGIDAVTLARMFTMGFEAPSNTDIGWILDTAANYPDESGLSETNLYLWQRKKTTYTESDDVTYEVSLINQYQSGLRANLLEDTAFREDNEMDGWKAHVGSVIKNTDIDLPQNGWQYGDSTEEYVDFLMQKIWDGTDVKKVQPNKWYTLSFFAAQEPLLHLFSGSAYNTGTSGIITKAMSHFYLAAGQSVTLYATGRVNNTTYAYMRIHVWTADDDDAWLQSDYVDIRAASNSQVSIVVTNYQSEGRIFNVCPYMYTVSNNSLVSSSSPLYRGYCTKIDVHRGCRLNTYISRGDLSADAIQHGSGSTIFVDGIKVNGPTTLSDGTRVNFNAACSIVWQLSETPKRHTVTFKTAAWGSTTDEIAVRFRHTSYSHNGWISMPKLEENTIATEWIENSADRYASDFQHIYVGDWKASTQNDLSTYYLYALGVRHVVRAKKSATESDMTYFRLKKRTPNTGYCSTQQPYADTTYWEEAGYLKFIAADLLLAEEVITDKLTVSKVRSKNDSFVIDENGNVSANGGNFSNVRVSAGSADGARVEITPATASDDGGKMAIYNASGNVVAQYSGETVSNPVNLYGNSSDNASIQIPNTSVSVANYDCPDFMWKTQSQDRTFNLTKQMVLSFPAITMYLEIQPAENLIEPKEDCLFRVSLYLNGNILYTYNDVAVRGERPSLTLNIPSRSVIGKAGQNVLTLELSLYDKDFSDKSGSYAEAHATMSGFTITASIEKQMSYHFANGLAIGMSSTQYFITYGIAAGMVHEMRSGTYGLRVHPTLGIQKWNGSQWVTANL